MNCIQPTAPAELGPMLRPKFDSTLLIAARTCHGTPYSAPAPCQSPRSCDESNCCGTAGGGGTNAVLDDQTTWKTSAVAVAATRERATSARSAARRTGSPVRGNDAQAGRHLFGHDELRRGGRLGLGGHRLGGRGLVGTLPLDRLLERDDEVVLVRGRVRCDLAVDAAREHVLD